MRRPTCPPALTPGQTSPRSSGTSSPPHHSCPHVLTSLFSTHALVSAQEERNLPSATARPLLPRRCLRALSSGSGRPHLCLLTARSGRRQRPDARTCSEKGQEGAGWAEEEEEEECAHILEHRGRTNALISPPRLSPTALLMYLPTNPVNTEPALGLKKTLP